jgi:hypothetical protein
MLFYIHNIVDKTTCIGNSLSTFNGSFTALDSNLYSLSTYTVNSVNFLSSTMISVSSTLNNRIGFLSATMISVSSTLANNISSLSSYVFTNLNPRVETLSTNVNSIINNLTYSAFAGYYTPVSYSTVGDGQNLTLNLNPSSNNLEKQNAQIRLRHNVGINDFTYAPNGLNGTISVFIDTAGKSITGYGPTWIFTGTSALKTTLSARNLIHYYVDVFNNSTRVLAELKTY